MEGDNLRQCGEQKAATSSPPPPDNIQPLPQEILLHIFSFLSPTDLCQTVPRVCTLWEELHRDYRLYRELSFSPDDSLETVDKCMELAICLQSFTLTSNDLSDMSRKLLLDSVQENIGKQLRSFSLKLTYRCFLYTYGSDTKMYFEMNVLTLLRKCSNLQMLHLELCWICSSRFFTFLSDASFYPMLVKRRLRIIRFVNMGSVSAQSERYFVRSCMRLKEISVYSNCMEGTRFPIVFTGNELSGMCERLYGTLRVLHLNYGNWSAEDLRSLTICHCLQDLCFYNAKSLSDEVLLVIGSLTGLRKLEIRDCRKATEVGWIRMITSPTLKSLNSLVLDGASITNETALAVGANISNLKKLFLYRSGQSAIDMFVLRIFPTGFKSVIRGCPNLEELSLNSVDPVSLSAVIHIPHFLPRLQKLSIGPEPHSHCSWIIALKKKMPHLRLNSVWVV